MRFDIILHPADRVGRFPFTRINHRLLTAYQLRGARLELPCGISDTEPFIPFSFSSHDRLQYNPTEGRSQSAPLSKIQSFCGAILNQFLMFLKLGF
jgi:hypothetical protein